MRIIEVCYRAVRTFFAPHDQRGNPSCGAWQQRVRDAALEMLEPVRGNLLEIGCGEGIWLRSWHNAHPDSRIIPVGIDICLPQLKAAQERMRAHPQKNARFLCADASKLPLKEALFDSVVCINVFMNLESARALEMVTHEIARVLVPGGRVVFDLRNARNWLVRCKYRWVGLYDRTIEAHRLKTYRLDDLTRVCANAGLRIAQVRSLAGKGPGAPILVCVALKEKVQ
jgi:ubiquinone/menaquinone biosynthesis C-methylase UbiE